MKYNIILRKLSTAMLTFHFLMQFVTYVQSSALDAKFRLYILHQNDLHAHFGEVTTSTNPCNNQIYKKCYGGFARAVKYVHSLRAAFAPTLVLNAGDFYQGSAFYSIFKWRYVVDMMKQMPYDALALGNSEFTDGLEGLIPFIRAVPKFVCTNVKFTGLNRTLQAELEQLCPEYRIIDLPTGLPQFPLMRVAILGYTSPVTANISRTSNVVFEDEVIALSRVANYVQRNFTATIIVALGHSGYTRDLEIARRVPHLDVVIGGHSHTLNWPNDVNPFVAGVPEDQNDKDIASGVYPTPVIQPSGRLVLVAQMYKHGKYMGVLVPYFDFYDEVQEWWPLPRLLDSSIPEDETTKAMHSNYSDQLEYRSHEVIGQTLVHLVGNYNICHVAECTFGNLLVNAIIWSLHEYFTVGPRTTVVMLNSGSIVFDIARGQITFSDLLGTLPYQNTIDVLEITGTTMIKMLENSVADLDNLHGRFLQLAGVRVVYNRSQPVGSRVHRVSVVCNRCPVPLFEPLVLDNIYQVAVTTFMAVGGDFYTMLLTDRVSLTPLHQLDLDIIVGYVRRMSPLYPRLDGRIQYVEKPPPLNSTASATLSGWMRSSMLALVSAMVSTTSALQLH